MTMNKDNRKSGWKYLCLLLLAINVIVSCNCDQKQLNTKKTTIIKERVKGMMANIETDVSKNGPRAWLNYFEDTPDFFMANEGQLVFKDHQSARAFIIGTVVKIIPYIKLRWEHIRIDPLTSNLASIGADFHEDQVTNTGKKLSIDGYFSGIAHYEGHDWKLRNAHWSVKAPATAGN
jgi:hypothetical protein